VTLVGCGSDDDAVSCLTAACTASNFVLPADAIYVSPGATDGTDLKDAIITVLTDVADNAVIVLPKGDFIVSSSITVTDATGYTITGHGIARL
jgi:hypothetical protein